MGTLHYLHGRTNPWQEIRIYNVNPARYHIGELKRMARARLKHWLTWPVRFVRGLLERRDVGKLKAELYQARLANLEEIKATNPERFREYQHRHGEYLARFAR